MAAAGKCATLAPQDQPSSSSCTLPASLPCQVLSSTTDNVDNGDRVLPIILNGTFFKVISHDGNRVRAECTKCHKILKGCWNATTNFRNHLKVKGHSVTEYESYVEKNFIHHRKRPIDNVAVAAPTESIKKRLKQSSLFGNVTAKEQQIADNLITNFVIHTMSPMVIVEHEAFINLITGINNMKTSVKVMTRKTLSKRIADDYSKIMTTIKAQLNNVEYVCTTADIWSTSKRSYMGVTAHWIDEKLNRKSAALACRRFTGKHTYDKVASMINDIHEEFIDKKSKTIIVKTVTDNGSNMIKAFSKSQVKGKDDDAQTSNSILQQLLGDRSLTNIIEIVDEDEEDELEDEMLGTAISEVITQQSANGDDIFLPPHQRCVSHTLNLITTTDIKNFYMKNSGGLFNSRLHNLYKSAFAKCTAIWNLTARSPKACETYEKITSKSCNSPCPTRWNSQFDCLENLLQTRTHLPNICDSLGLARFRESELEFLSEYLEVVRPFAETLDNLQGSKNTFYGELLPHLFRLRKKLQAIGMRQLQFCTELVKYLVIRLNSRFEDYFSLTSSVNDAILASVSHPFFKLKWVPKEKKIFVKQILNEIELLIRKNVKDCNDKDKNSTNLPDDYFMFEESDSSNSETTVNNALQFRALQFLQSSEIELSMLNNYPEVKNVFIKYNTPLPSSGAVERLFSYGGMIMRPKRRNMTDDVFEKQLIIKANSVFSY